MHTQKSKSKVSWCKRYSENGRTDTTDRITCLSFAAGNYRKPVLDVDPTTFAIFTSPTGPGSVLARTLNSRETLPGPRLGKTISWDTDKTRYDTIRYDKRSYFNVRSNAESTARNQQLKSENREKLKKVKKWMLRGIGKQSRESPEKDSYGGKDLQKKKVA